MLKNTNIKYFLFTFLFSLTLVNTKTKTKYEYPIFETRTTTVQIIYVVLEHSIISNFGHRSTFPQQKRIVRAVFRAQIKLAKARISIPVSPMLAETSHNHAQVYYAVKFRITEQHYKIL